MIGQSLKENNKGDEDQERKKEERQKDAVFSVNQQLVLQKIKSI